MYQNRLGPSCGIYYPNFVPCFVVLYLKSQCWSNEPNQTKTGLNLVCWVRWYTIALSHAWDGAFSWVLLAGRLCQTSGGARAHVWAPSSANWGISSTSLAACSQLENHFLVDTHKNFSCFLLCQGKQAEILTKSLVVIPEKSAGLWSA